MLYKVLYGGGGSFLESSLVQIIIISHNWRYPTNHQNNHIQIYTSRGKEFKNSDIQARILPIWRPSLFFWLSPCISRCSSISSPRPVIHTVSHSLTINFNCGHISDIYLSHFSDKYLTYDITHISGISQPYLRLISAIIHAYLTVKAR